MNTNDTFIDFIIKGTNKYIKIKIDDDKKIDEILQNNLFSMKRLICLDFHGVADLYHDNEKIPNELPKVIISYIGGSPSTLQNAFNSINPRVQSGEVLLGIVVYKKHDEPICGTKGWVLNKIALIESIKRIYFIDDSRKNIQCVNNVHNDKIKTYYLDKKSSNPKELLTALLNRKI